jgi:hypothetical protein
MNESWNSKFNRVLGGFSIIYSGMRGKILKQRKNQSGRPITSTTTCTRFGMAQQIGCHERKGESGGMNDRDKLERIRRHAAVYHHHKFWILGLGYGYQAGYGNVDSTGARSMPVHERLDDALDSMLRAPCSCLKHAGGMDGEILE